MEGWLSMGVEEGEMGEVGRVMGWGLWIPASSSPRRKRGRREGKGRRKKRREREREEKDLRHT